MIKLATTADINSRCTDFISPIDAKFGFYAKSLNLADLQEVAAQIDNTVVESKSIIVGKFFGERTTIRNLSTGCKTVLLCRHLRESESIIDLRECGWNALIPAFWELDGSNARGYLNFFPIGDMRRFAELDFEFEFSGEIFNSVKIMRKLLRGEI